MGRKWNNKKKKRAETKVDKPKRSRSDQGYVVAVKENKDFETFYKNQNIVPEEEWSDFITSLQSSLPVAFRITGNTTQAGALLKILKNDFFEPLKDIGEVITPASCISKSSNTDKNGSNGAAEKATGSSATEGNGAAEAEEPIKPLEPKCLDWYPRGLAYQLNLSRRDIRRCEPYWRLHQCLITETDAGSISRQEAVSMIPPLLLDVQPHHKVLDMCAAPGSKTAQLIEQLHSSADPVAGAIPPGVVVANDADNKRCYLLTHQAKRLQSPSIIITNHDAAFMPNMFYTKPDGRSGKMKFDRILCDVPCSGDGTLRKNCDVWMKWNPVNGCNLHGLQLRIARRGLELLSVGGRMVYSTCSMSPMENEAVLQRLLTEAKGSVHIVDVKGALPDLKYCPGLTKWSVMSKDMKIIPTPADIPAAWSNVYHKHLFPVEEDLHLDRCLRLLPHHQDTGGFFVAVLEKTAPLPGEAAEDCDTTGPLRTVVKPAQRYKPAPKNRRQGFKEEPYYYLSDKISEWEKKFKAGEAVEPYTPVYETNSDNKLESETMETDTKAATSEAEVKTSEAEVKTSEAEVKTSEAEVATPENADDNITSQVSAEDDKQSAAAAPAKPYDADQEDLRIWSHLSTFYGMAKDIPEASYTNFMTRSKEGKTRNLYFTNSFVRDLIDRNQDKMKIINTGVKVFVRTDNKGALCDFRLAQEGIQSILPLITQRRLPVSRDDMVHVLNDNDNDQPPELARMSLMCRSVANKIVTGSVLMEYNGDPSKPDDEQDSVKEEDKIKIELVGWKGKSTMRCYVARNDRIHYLRLMRADTSRYVTNKFRAAATNGSNETAGEETSKKDDETAEEISKKDDEIAEETSKKDDEPQNVAKKMRLSDESEDSNVEVNSAVGHTAMETN